MHEHRLLLPTAKAGVLVPTSNPPSHWTRKVVLALGVLAILIGAADALSRASEKVFGCNAGVAVFAPAIVALDPSASPYSPPGAPCP